jgi:hypothetical protein
MAACAELIQTTNLTGSVATAAAGLAPHYRIAGQILGTADLLAQMSDPLYLEKCRDFLYREFVIANMDWTVDQAGQRITIYESGNHLLLKTPGFYRGFVIGRLETEFGGVYRYLTAHFEREDPVMAAVRANMARLDNAMAKGDLTVLDRLPRALIPADCSVST